MPTGTNEFKAFATGAGANVLTQAAYEALTTLIANGFQTGVAQSDQLNKVWRQSSFVAAAVAQLIADAGTNAVDDGNLTTFVTNLKAAINAVLAVSTPPQFDNDASIATTEFVQRALGNLRGGQSTNASVTLSVNNIGQFYSFYGGTANQIITLPAANTIPAGSGVTIVNQGSVAVSVARTGSDTFNVNTGTGASSATSVTLRPGDSVFFVSNGASVWNMVGAPIFQTRPQFDNTTNLASTEFVRIAGLQASACSSASSTQTLTASAFGKILLVGSTFATITLTLPLAMNGDSGSIITLYNSASYAVTVQRQGTDNIYFGTTVVTSFVLAPGDSAVLTRYGTTYDWYVISGSASLRSSTGDFGKSLSGSGYQKLPSGLIVQWGSANPPTANTPLTVTLPIAFPTAALQDVAAWSNNGNTGSSSVGTLTTSTINLLSSLGGIAIRYIAIGY